MEVPKESRLRGSLEDRIRRLELLTGITPSGTAAKVVGRTVEEINEALEYERRTGRLYPDCELDPPEYVPHA